MTWNALDILLPPAMAKGVVGGKGIILALSGRIQIKNAEQFVSALRRGYHKSLQINLVLIPETAIIIANCFIKSRDHQQSP